MKKYILVLIAIFSTALQINATQQIRSELVNALDKINNIISVNKIYSVNEENIILRRLREYKWSGIEIVTPQILKRTLEEDLDKEACPNCCFRSRRQSIINNVVLLYTQLKTNSNQNISIQVMN